MRNGTDITIHAHGGENAHESGSIYTAGGLSSLDLSQQSAALTL
ncbi:MAG: hypothetical protein ACI9DC_002119 [Gammaproteobacteria bacterium]